MNTLYIINEVHIQGFGIPNAWFLSCPCDKVTCALLHVVIFPNHARIVCCFLCFPSSDLPCNYSVVKRSLLYHLFSLLNIPPSMLLKVRTFISTQTVQYVIPLSNIQILEHLLSEDRVFLQNILCCQFYGIHISFVLALLLLS